MASEERAAHPVKKLEINPDDVELPFPEEMLGFQSQATENLAGPIC
jgi:hypothetical protein